MGMISREEKCRRCRAHAPYNAEEKVPCANPDSRWKLYDGGCPPTKMINKWRKAHYKETNRRKNSTTQCEEEFYRHVKTLIRNFLIRNPNFYNSQWHNKTAHQAIDYVKELAQHILDKIEDTKHLILEK
jgi:hypothetical protein